MSILREQEASGMRMGAEFSRPWPLRVNPHVDQARDSAIAWMLEFGLLRGERAVREFVDWRLAEVAAFFYPRASAEDCCTAAQMMGWYFLPFDDQLDGDLGRDPHRVSQVCTALIAIVHGTTDVRSHDAPTVRAFADLWGRMVRGMSPSLRSRVAFHWSSYFSSQLTEAMDRSNGYSYLDLETYFDFRAATTCAFGQNDLAEKWGGSEVPAVVWHHPVLKRMRQLGADLVAIRNDSMSTSHEDVDGLHNAIHIIERTQSCTREEAVERASALGQEKVSQLVAIEEEQLPQLLSHLDGAQQRAVLGYADTIHDWICGDYEWEQISARHASHRPMPEWASELLVAAGS
ncbi:terpene synthase family protein [Streptomyces sp. NE06-03C]|uniref:terpene synthase family protein n=1 Tax=Streptomyces sp. NE06-03C TaxID=3028694 RepID=UPI0029A1F6C5|nr:hypothetical protein [Streptomyces sp. NE06-03C]MDX2918968.1 hypothetical protein [Streptomyces sp. NE06-03C]